MGIRISDRGYCRKTCWENCVAQKDVQKAATTGTAASVICYETLHALCHIPGMSTKKPLPALGPGRLEEMQNKFKDVFLISIDKRSMIVLYTIYVIYQRLRRVKPEITIN